MTPSTRRPFVVDLRDWLSCLALILASFIMLIGISAGWRLASTDRPGGTSVVPQLVPDPGLRPAPHPGPPIGGPR